MPDETELPDFDETVAAGQAVSGETITETESAPEEVVVNPLFEEARAAGLELGEDISDSDGLARYLLKEIASQRPYAEFGRSTLSQAQQPQTATNNQQGTEDSDDSADAAEFDEHKFFSEAWNVPQLSPGAQWALKAGAFTEGKSGMLEPVPGLEQAALPYVKEINDYQRARVQLNETFAENPIKFLAEKLTPYFQHKLSRQFEQLSQQSVQTYEQQSFVDKFRAENAAWMYNQQGTAFTAHGQQFAELVNELQQQGMSDLAAATKYALKIMPPPTKEGGDPKDQQAKPAPAAPLTGERGRDEQGRFKPAGKPAPAPQKESFVDKAKQRAMAGHAAIGATPENTVVASEGDLDSMWESSWRAHASAN